MMPSMENSRKRPFFQRENRTKCSRFNPPVCSPMVKQLLLLPCCMQSAITCPDCPASPFVPLIRNQVEPMQGSRVPRSPGRCRTGWGMGVERALHLWVQALSVRGQTPPLAPSSFNLPLGALLLLRPCLSVKASHPASWCLEGTAARFSGLPLPALKSGSPA